MLSSYLSRRLITIVYQLQYSAVSSQISRHEVAIKSTLKALFYIQEILTE